jgi:hypothetical protein
MSSDTTELIELLSVIINVVNVIFDMIKNLIVSKNLINGRVWNFANKLHVL